eukprot:scaffold82460_cov53-Phaeocystis_antarctica.AAC.3
MASALPPMGGLAREDPGLQSERVHTTLWRLSRARGALRSPIGDRGQDQGPGLKPYAHQITMPDITFAL